MASPGSACIARPSRSSRPVAEEFELHELAVEDAVKAHQRPKLERYGDTLFCVLRPARYIDASETVEFGEVHVFAGPHFVITVRHGEAPDLAAVRAGLEARPDLLCRGAVAVLHAIMDRVVDDYAPVVAGVENDIDEIEDEVFGGQVDVSRRVYELSREVIAFQRATRPLVPMLDKLMSDADVDEEERRYLRDVQDHALRHVEQADAFRQLLQNILNVNLTLETKALNEASTPRTSQITIGSFWPGEGRRWPRFGHPRHGTTLTSGSSTVAPAPSWRRPTLASRLPAFAQPAGRP